MMFLSYALTDDGALPQHYILLVPNVHHFYKQDTISLYSCEASTQRFWIPHNPKPYKDRH